MNADEKGLADSHRRLYQQTIGALLILTALVQVSIGYFDVSNLTSKLYVVLLGQVTNVATMNAHTGDLITLQQNLESITSPLAMVMPIRVKVFQIDNGKLLVDITSANFSVSSRFVSDSETVIMANPYGALNLFVSFDYSSLVLSTVLKTLVSCTLLGCGLVVARSHIMAVSRVNLVPIDQFRTWLQNITPSSLRSGRLEMPSGLQDKEIQSLFADINSLAKELVQRGIQKQLMEIATQTAHDIRSPLSALKIVVGRSSQLPAEMRSLIVNSANRIETIADNLLQTYRVDSTFKTNLAENKPFSVRQILEPIVQEKELELLGRPEVILKSDWNAVSETQGLVNLSELHRVISNLFNNSLEAITGEGEITVGARIRDQTVAIVISDNGRGIPKDLLNKLGTRGFTLKSGKNFGFGLGLSHARDVMTDMNGSIQFQSKEGIGTIVTLEFPLSPKIC